MERVKIIFVIFLWGILNTVLAVEIDHFIVEVKPSPTNVNQANDLIIKAVDVDDNVVTDYEGDILMSVTNSEGVDITDNQDIVVLPDDGVATFTVDDDGVKTYSKGLIFKKAGIYTIEVSDLTQDDIIGQVKIQVNDEGVKEYNANITVETPINGSKETQLPIDVNATTDSPNTVYQIYVDGKKIKEGLTDENGQINDVIDSVSKGEHTMYIKMLDVNGNEIGKSNEISFVYQSSEEGNLFNKINIYPSNIVNVGEQVVFEVETDSSVNNAELKIGDLGTFPLDKENDGKFKLTLQMDKQGKFFIDVILYVNGDKKVYTNVSNIEVRQIISVKNVKFNPDFEKREIKISWDYTGSPKKFRILLGTDRNNLTVYKVVDVNNTTITGLDENKKIYYFQIVPVDDNGNKIGESSSILEISLDMKQVASSCVVKDVKLKLKIIDGKHYIVWDKVDGANNYVVYVSDNPEGPFDKLGETADTKWEYPFDPNSKQEIYKYFKVEAICNDGSKVQIDTVKKVKVGPEYTILFLFIISLVLYSYIKLLKVYKE